MIPEGFTPPTPTAELRHILHDVAGGMLLTELCRRFASRSEDLRDALAALKADALVEAVLLPGDRVGVRWTGATPPPLVRNRARTTREAAERMRHGAGMVAGGMSISAAAKAVGINKGTLKGYIDRAKRGTADAPL